MNTPLDVWPFLVSGKWHVDYRTIVAPDFICQEKSLILDEVAPSGIISQDNSAFYREIYTKKKEKLTIVFRVIETTFEDMGVEVTLRDSSGQEILLSGALRDSFGRKIRVVEGIVIKGFVPNIVVTKEDIAKVHALIVEPYRLGFSERTVQPVVPSKCFSLPQNSPEYCLTYQKLEAYDAVPPLPTPIATKPQTSNNDRTQNSERNLSDYQSSSYQSIGELSGRNKDQTWSKFNSISVGDEVISVAFFPNEKLKIAIRQNQTVTIINVYDKSNTKIYQDEDNDKQTDKYPTPIVITPNGKYIATAFTKGKGKNIIKVWDETKQNNNLKSFYPTDYSTETEPVMFGFFAKTTLSETFLDRVLAFTPNSEILVSVEQDKSIVFWDVKSGGKFGDTIYIDQSITAIAVSPDESTPILAIAYSGKIQFWDWNSRQKESYLSYDSPVPVNSLVFSRDGRKIVSGGNDGSVKLWDVDKRELLKSGKHSYKVNALAFSPDGKLIASGDDQGHIKIWDVETMQSMVLPKHYSSVTSVAFSPDGKILASGADKTVQLWQRL